MERNKEPNENDLKLELVQVIFRHGARTPIVEELNTYTFNDVSAYEPWGIGHLTNVGKKMEYDFGVFLRKRYKNFLSEHYEPHEVFAYSTDYHRTKMSLQLVLAGLYPPVGHAVWNPNLIWSPIPYTHALASMDILFLHWWSPRCRKIRDQVIQSEDFRKKIDEFADFLTFLTAKTNVDLTYANFNNISFLYGTFDVDKSLNLPLPNWYSPEVKKKFQQLMSCYFDGWTFTMELKKLSVGALMKTLIDNMNLEGAYQNPRKLYLYSAHDANIALLIKSHNIKELIYPEFGCGLILEKLRGSNNQLYVRLLYWSGTGSLKPLKLGNYKEFCPIVEYLKIVEPVIPSESEINAMFKDVSEGKNLRSELFSDKVVIKSRNKL